jgi:CheY-like chemotaxis protein
MRRRVKIRRRFHWPFSLAAFIGRFHRPARQTGAGGRGIGLRYRPAKGAGSRVTQKRVLVVEDEALIRMLAVDMLLDLDIVADEAGTAGEALDLLRSYRLVFMDIGLPDLHGDDLIRGIRDHHPDLPLLIASGEDQEILRSRLNGFSPIAFLGKPYDIGQLGTALKTLGI